jgi:hypothetical protein
MTGKLLSIDVSRERRNHEPTFYFSTGRIRGENFKVFHIGSDIHTTRAFLKEFRHRIKSIDKRKYFSSINF